MAGRAENEHCSSDTPLSKEQEVDIKVTNRRLDFYREPGDSIAYLRKIQGPKDKSLWGEANCFSEANSNQFAKYLWVQCFKN